MNIKNYELVSEIAKLREQLEEAKESREVSRFQHEHWKQRAEAAEAELLEQARLNGMGSEREASLIAKLADQQAQYLALRAWFKKDSSCTCETCWSCAGKGAALLSETVRTEELNTLLAQARDEGRLSAVPDGWQVVPKEPTAEMVHQGVKCIYTDWAYRVMLAAAPKPEVKP